MKTKGNTALITGGATGIGFALAQDLVKAGNNVIICGRREHKLAQAKTKLPQIATVSVDVTREKDRKGLFKFIKERYPRLNILEQRWHTEND